MNYPKTGLIVGLVAVTVSYITMRSGIPVLFYLSLVINFVGLCLALISLWKIDNDKKTKKNGG